MNLSIAKTAGIALSGITLAAAVGGLLPTTSPIGPSTPITPISTPVIDPPTPDPTPVGGGGGGADHVCINYLVEVAGIESADGQGGIAPLEISYLIIELSGSLSTLTLELDAESGGGALIGDFLNATWPTDASVGALVFDDSAITVGADGVSWSVGEGDSTTVLGSLDGLAVAAIEAPVDGTSDTLWITVLDNRGGAWLIELTILESDSGSCVSDSF